MSQSRWISPSHSPVSKHRSAENVQSSRSAFANDELRKANEDLESRVEERTSRLIDANQKLKIEIADREELQARSQYLAYHDSLTGLGNRLLFKEHLEEALTDVSVTPHPLAVLFLDLDGFKSVNDTLGHSVGDLLLKSVATKLRDILRPTDRIARLGGDEFAILQIPGAQPGSSIALAQKESSRLLVSRVQYRRSRCNCRRQDLESRSDLQTRRMQRLF